MSKRSGVLVGVLVASGVWACGGGDGAEGKQTSPVTSKEKTAPAPSATGAPSSSAPSASKACSLPGAKANDKEVGAYCDKSTKCSGTTFCTADFGAPAGATFCTHLCAADADCGASAFCYHHAAGSACITNACDPRGQ
jgi:hypothetical protein